MNKKDQLLTSLHSKEESERLYAVEDILDVGLLELSLELLDQLKIETSPAVKNSIVSVMQKMEYPEAYPIIFKLFPYKDAFIRNSAVSMFASYGENAVIFLSSYLDHSDKEVRKLILDSLVEIATKQAETKVSVLDIFRACLHDPAINVVITAIEYLGKLGDNNNLDDMIQLYQRTNEPMLRSAILDYVLKIGKKEDFQTVLFALFENVHKVDTLYIPQVMRLMTKCGKKNEFLQLAKEKQKQSNFNEDILTCIDWLVKNENLELRECIPIIKEIASADNLADDLRIISVTLLIASGENDAMEFVRGWGLKGTKEFQTFCIESLGVMK